LGAGGFAALELLLAPSRSTLACALILFGIGLCFTVWTSNSNSSLQLGAPDHLRGRVVGLYYYCFNGLGPVGGLLAGWLAARGGTSLAFVASGLIGVGMTAFALAELRPRREARFTAS